MSFLTAYTQQVPDTLLTSLRAYYHHKTTAEIEEFTYTEKGKWLKYMPTFGIGLANGSSTEDTELGLTAIPQLNFNTRTLYTVINDRQRTKARVRSIIHRNELAFSEDARKIEHLIEEAEQQQLQLEALHKEYVLRYALFQIDSTQYKALELKPSAYLQAKLRWLQFQQTITEKEHQYARTQREIQLVARSGQPHQLNYPLLIAATQEETDKKKRK